MGNNEDILMDVPQETNMNELSSFTVICRLCATTNENSKFIGIYSEDGISNDLAMKINIYLPVKVYETDELPLQCCLQCVSTILAWHNLVITSIEADRRLKNSEFISHKDIDVPSTDYTSSHKETEPAESTLNAFDRTEALDEPDEKVNITYTDNLNDLVSLEPQYLNLSHEIYDIKSPVIESFEEELDKKGLENKTTPKYHKLDSGAEKVSNRKQKRKNTKIDQKLVKSARIIVDGKVYYSCKDCGRCLYSPYTYLCHMRIHTGERPHKCNQCGKQFRVSQGLVRHMKETHQGIKKFACDLCRRMFATRRNVEEHRRIHTNERPYVCDLCGKSFKQKASLFVHNRSHSDSFPFKCSFCNQAFRTKPPLLIHITKHTGEKPYPCDICGRHFRIKYELKRHRLIHSDEKPFSCEICGLSFKQKRYLRNHNKLNHNIVNV